MKKLRGIIPALLAVLFVVSCGKTTSQDSNVAKMPSAASDLEGKNYQDVVTQLQSAGFTNIETEPLGDLIIGWLYDEDGVEEVSCNGEIDFNEGDQFDKDVKIVVRYHSYPEKKEETAKADTEIHDTKQDSKTSIKESDKAIEPEEEKPEAKTSVQKEETEEKAPVSDEQEADTASSAEPEILNVGNCPELVEVFHVDNIEDPLIGAFAEKYAGKTIEFNGFIFEYWNHVDVSPFSGKETVREYHYDVFPVVGNVEDGEEPLLHGASLKMENVNGASFPAIFTEQNVHVVAKVKSYGDPYFLQLDPVSIEAR